MAFARMYALLLSKLVILGLMLGLAATPGFLLWRFLAFPVPAAALVSFLIALAEVMFLFWCVGRIFVRVDPSRDLND